MCNIVHRYILLPALLGDLVSQVMEGERLDTLHRAQASLYNIIHLLCVLYPIGDE